MSKHIYNFTLVISFLFLAIILYSANWALVLEKSDLVATTPILASAFVYIIFQITKVIRFTAIFPKHITPDFWTLYYVMTKHAYYLSILPARLGDVYFSTLLNQHTGVPHRLGNLSLFLARIYDILVLCTLTLIGVFYFDATLPIWLNVLIICLSIICIFLILNLVRILTLIGNLLRKRSEPRPGSLTNRLAINIDLILKEICAKHKIKTHAVILVATSLNWFGSIIMFWLILNMFNLELGILQVTFVVGIVNLFSLIPIQTIGGFGLREAGLFSALTLLGFAYEESISYAIVARLILYLIQLITSIIVMLFYNILTKINLKSVP